jgi:hypothetical protein
MICCSYLVVDQQISLTFCRGRENGEFCRFMVVTASAWDSVTEKVGPGPPGPVDSIALGPAIDDLVYLSVL